MTRRHALILLGAAVAPRVRAASVASPFTFERGLMGTRFAITCYHGDSNEAKVAADAKHTPGVMALIQTFTGEPTAKIYTVADQGKRAEFLAALAAL